MKCHLNFSDENSMKLHIKTHTGKRLCKCKHCVNCHKCFTKTTALKIQHSGEKPWNLTRFAIWIVYVKISSHWSHLKCIPQYVSSSVLSLVNAAYIHMANFNMFYNLALFSEHFITFVTLQLLLRSIHQSSCNVSENCHEWKQKLSASPGCPACAFSKYQLELMRCSIIHKQNLELGVWSQCVA